MKFEEFKMNERSDAMLMEILRERKTIENFLDSIFGFLRRKTDFYHNKESDETIGFPKGLQEKLVFCAMQRFNPEFHVNKLASEHNGPDDVPPAVEEIEITTSEVPIVSAESASKIEAIEPKDIFVSDDFKNGSVYETYCWSQTIKDVELHVKLPESLQSSKLITVDIKSDSILVKDKKEPTHIILNGKLCNKFKYNDAVWTICEKKLLISFDKCKNVWWDKLFDTEENIDPKSLDCEQYIDELSQDSQTAIRKLQVEQMERDNDQLKEDPHDAEMREKLRKAWYENDSLKGSSFENVQFIRN